MFGDRESESMSSRQFRMEEVYRQVVAKAGDAILFADREGVIRLWNSGAEALFGYTPEEAVGRPLDLLIPEKLRRKHWDGYRRVMRTGVSRYASGELLKVPALRKDGTRLSIEFSIVIVHEDDGRPAGAAAILRDVTERWNRERAAKRAAGEKSRGAPTERG